MFCYPAILSHPLFFYAYKELTINISFFYADLILTDDEKKNIALYYIEELLRARGSSLRRWEEMPYPDD